LFTAMNNASGEPSQQYSNISQCMGADQQSDLTPSRTS
jgi:hypothetical protein